MQKKPIVDISNKKGMDSAKLPKDQVFLKVCRTYLTLYYWAQSIILTLMITSLRSLFLVNALKSLRNCDLHSWRIQMKIFQALSDGPLLLSEYPLCFSANTLSALTVPIIYIYRHSGSRGETTANREFPPVSAVSAPYTWLQVATAF